MVLQAKKVSDHFPIEFQLQFQGIIIVHTHIVYVFSHEISILCIRTYDISQTQAQVQRSLQTQAQVLRSLQL